MAHIHKFTLKNYVKLCAPSKFAQIGAPPRGNTLCCGSSFTAGNNLLITLCLFN